MFPDSRNPHSANSDRETPLWAQQDEWLAPHYEEIRAWQRYIKKRRQLFLGTLATRGGLAAWACGHLYFGLHRTTTGWVLREYAPAARAIYLLCDANGWQKADAYRFTPLHSSEGTPSGEWSLELPATALHHLDYYKLLICTADEELERIPAYANYVVQDPRDYSFCTRVWSPEQPYRMTAPSPKRPDTLLIYECHIGMSGEELGVATYEQFRKERLPYIVSSGYNTLQIMAVQEHPYYGSYGYHVSNFFAPSSRFGTPDELKRLVDEAHALGLYVIMDLVHSHAVRNEAEGLARYDGTRTLFFHEGSRGEHPQWDSLCFDYGRSEVVHYLLSNCHYWLTEYGFDGFRFDGVTSMIYLDHGLERSFLTYEDYYDGCIDRDALTYLTLANELVHAVKPSATTIAEEVSGLPGLCESLAIGGYGFDYRLAMNVPDYWIKLIKEQPDEAWNPENMWYELRNHRPTERTISYAESHDQALVGDKTIIFRLIDSDMYWHMQQSDWHDRVMRGIALCNMIRLMTFATMCGGYLTFMGNEFGHPEWIDFPRQGNGYSYQYARRQWSLRANGLLRYAQLAHFDEKMLALCQLEPCFAELPDYCYHSHTERQFIAFMRGDALLFTFNYSPTESYCDYAIEGVPTGQYELLLDSDAVACGGFGRIDSSVRHHTRSNAEGRTELRLYLPARSAQVYRRKP
ncbi:alpha amylase C-terminal domain-containing protein [uncultured Porphyromonas sp.]|uniref:alpha amylase C-terminal domain-containing protein n=1 Tax=uncultured Porphyromonas sp. TaxID=159274 RepID=UPI00262D9E1B|nr:alpha amylase C-terminal domain-containing protein [uncultured Porphyromonas sp.]